MKDINRFTVTGTVERKPHMAVTQGGMSILSVRLTQALPKKVNGEWTTVDGILEVKMFGAAADEYDGQVQAGDSVVVEGKLNARENEGRNGGTFVNLTAQAERIVVMGRAGQPAESKPDAPADDFNDEELPF